MANNINDLLPQLVAQALMTLRPMLVIPRLINNDYADIGASRGDTINIPIPQAISVQDVVPSNTPPVTADITDNTVPLKLDFWKEASFHLSHKELAIVDQGIALPMRAEEAVKSLAEQVNSDIIAEYKRVYQATGTPGTTPFASSMTAATKAKSILTKQGSRSTDRRIVLNSEATENALELAKFSDTSQSGDPNVIGEGVLGRKLGFDWYEQPAMPSHTAGTPGGSLTINGAHSVDASSISVANSGTGNIVAGDIFTIAGHDQQYVVTSDVTWAAIGNETVVISPSLKAALSGGEAITVVGAGTTYDISLAFHKNALAFASRRLDEPSIEGMNIQGMMSSMADPMTGIVLRAEITHEHKRWRWSFDILYGVRCVRPELAVRILG